MKFHKIKLAVLLSSFACLATVAAAEANPTVASAGKTPAPAVAASASASGVKPSPAAFVASVKKQVSKVKFNGFLSAGASVSDSKALYEIPGHGAINNQVGYAANSLFGVQMQADLNDQLSVVAQLVANGNNLDGNVPYRVNAEWAFLKYKPFENLQVRAGRFRMPLFMYSDTLEVGYSYPWIFAPNEVYRLVPFYNMNGADAIYTHTLGNSNWTVRIQPFLGATETTYDMPRLTENSPIIPANFAVNNILGVAGSVGNDVFTLRGAYASTSLTGKLPNGVTLFSNQSAQFYSVGAKLNTHNILLLSEWAHRSTPNQLASLTGYYATLGYQYKKWLPNFTYAALTTTNAAALRAQAPVNPLAPLMIQDQNSYTVGLSYFIDPHVVAKVSASQVNPLNGSRGLFQTDPGKAHVGVYSVGIDVVF